MRLTFAAPDLTEPTYNTLEEYATKKFKKVEKVLPRKKETEYEMRISARKNRDIFEVTAEIANVNPGVSSAKDRDLRKAIDLAADQLRSQLRRNKEKRIDVQRIKGRVSKMLHRSNE